MEPKDLLKIVMVFFVVGILLGVGLIVLDRFGDAAKTRTNLINETVAISSGTGTTANDEVTTLTSVENVTNHTLVIGNSDGAQVNWTADGVLTVDSATGHVADGSYNVTYTYDADSTATTAIGSTETALSTISSTWIPILVIIMIVGIILGLVLNNFANQRRP